MRLKQKTIIIGVSSGIAGYKVINLIKLLRKKRCNVYVTMTQHAKEMFGEKPFEKASGHKIFSEIIPSDFNYKEILEKKTVDHVKIAEKADLFVVVPATANIIGKIAHGIADDFLTTTILVATTPILVCPSMNTNMWNNPAVVNNIEKLKKYGYHILSPSSGKLACGTYGEGRLPEIEIIADEINHILENRARLKGKKIIVTAGGTQEIIDPVRVITNRSSGKMGIALAEECYFQGAEVLLLRSKTGVAPKYPIREELFENAKKLENLIRKHVQNYDCIFHAAAVSDFIPKEQIDNKIDSSKDLILKLKSSPKICNYIKKWNPRIKLIGFKAVYKEKEKNLIEKGIKKLRESNADYIIVNDIGRKGVGFGSDDNEVYIILPRGLLAKIEKALKKEIAKKIIEIVFQ